MLDYINIGSKMNRKILLDSYLVLGLDIDEIMNLTEEEKDSIIQKHYERREMDYLWQLEDIEEEKTSLRERLKEVKSKREEKNNSIIAAKLEEEQKKLIARNDKMLKKLNKLRIQKGYIEEAYENLKNTTCREKYHKKYYANPNVISDAKHIDETIRTIPIPRATIENGKFFYNRSGVTKQEKEQEPIKDYYSMLGLDVENMLDTYFSEEEKNDMVEKSYRRSIEARNREIKNIEEILGISLEEIEEKEQNANTNFKLLKQLKEEVFNIKEAYENLKNSKQRRDYNTLYIVTMQSEQENSANLEEKGKENNQEAYNESRQMTEEEFLKMKRYIKKTDTIIERIKANTEEWKVQEDKKKLKFIPINKGEMGKEEELDR